MLFLMNLNAQTDAQPVKWSFSIEEVEDEYILTANADIKDGWAIYSQHTGEGGPIPTRFEIEDIEVTFEEESKAITQFSSLFEVEVKKFKNEAGFTFLLNKNSVEGNVTFMACNENQCLPPKTIGFDL